MKAFLSETYGSPDVFRLAEIDTPAPGAGQVLVKVLALSVNPADWHCLRGKPLFARATLGVVKPKATILGCDVAGRVEAVGPGVTDVQPGDAVYANLLDTGFGGFAEYVAVPVDVLAPAAPTLSFEEAAAIPMAAVTALQGLRYHSEIRSGQAVLVNGASGGVGHFGVQIAKASGAVVTGVTSTSKGDVPAPVASDARRQIHRQHHRQIHALLCGRTTRKIAADPHVTVDSTAGARMRTILGSALPRHAEAAVNAALEDTRVVLVNGARQSGKSTLARLVEKAATPNGVISIPP